MFLLLKYDKFDRGACEPKGGEIVNKNIKPGKFLLSLGTFSPILVKILGCIDLHHDISAFQLFS